MIGMTIAKIQFESSAKLDIVTKCLCHLCKSLF